MGNQMESLYGPGLETARVVSAHAFTARVWTHRPNWECGLAEFPLEKENVFWRMHSTPCVPQRASYRSLDCEELVFS